MFYTVAFFNIGGTQIILLGFLGLLLFGKDLPTIARNAARQYYYYRRKFSEATADIQREMENAASVIEEEKRKIQHEVTRDMPKLSDFDNKPFPEGDNPAPDASAAYALDHPVTPSLPARPAADPLALDVPAPTTLAHKPSDPVKSTLAQATALDSLKSVPPPSKIPPPLG